MVCSTGLACLSVAVGMYFLRFIVCEVSNREHCLPPIGTAPGIEVPFLPVFDPTVAVELTLFYRAGHDASQQLSGRIAHRNGSARLAHDRGLFFVKQDCLHCNELLSL